MPRIFSIILWCGLVACSGCKNSETVTIAAPTPAPVAAPAQFPAPARSNYTQAQQIEKTWPSKLKIAKQSFSYNHTGMRSYEISVEYPQIKRPRPSNGLRFNRWIRNKVMGYVREFKHLEQSASVSDRKRKLSPVHITEALSLSYIVYYSHSRLVSLRLTHSVMAIGQMHPIDYYETLNCDLRRGVPLQEHEVFKRGYLKVFSNYTRKHLQENYAKDFRTDELLREGTSPRRINFPNWNIVPDGILIAFEDYQIASHSFGQLELIIPYSELKAVLRRKSRRSGTVFLYTN